MAVTKNRLFTTPKVCKCANGEWFIFFRYFNAATGKMQSVKRSEGLNRIHNLKEKEAEFNALREARETWLKTGWNPLLDPDFKNRPVLGTDAADLEKLQQMTFEQAIDFAYKSKLPGWAKKSKSSYQSVVKYIKEAAVLIGLLHKPFIELKRAHYRTLLEHTKVHRKLSDKGYNKYRRYLSTLIGELVNEYEVLEYNPVEKIKTKAVAKTVAHRPPTQDQRILIVNRIKNTNRKYYRFLAVLYGCTIRPKEITGLKIKNLHRLEQVFRLLPDNDSSTKTKIEREVAIPDWVMDLLSELNLHNYDPEWYIFSGGNRHHSYLPGTRRMQADASTKLWHKIVKEDLGLDVNQYSLKKLSGDDMIRLQRREGVNNLLELPRAQMGHTSTDMTEVYVTEHLEVMKELVKRKMPEL